MNAMRMKPPFSELVAHVAEVEERHIREREHADVFMGGDDSAEARDAAKEHDMMLELGLPVVVDAFTARAGRVLAMEVCMYAYNLNAVSLHSMMWAMEYWHKCMRRCVVVRECAERDAKLQCEWGGDVQGWKQFNKNESESTWFTALGYGQESPWRSEYLLGFLAGKFEQSQTSSESARKRDMGYLLHVELVVACLVLARKMHDKDCDGVSGSEWDLTSNQIAARLQLDISRKWFGFEANSVSLVEILGLSAVGTGSISQSASRQYVQGEIARLLRRREDMALHLLRWNLGMFSEIDFACALVESLEECVVGLTSGGNGMEIGLKAGSVEWWHSFRQHTWYAVQVLVRLRNSMCRSSEVLALAFGTDVHVDVDVDCRSVTVQAACMWALRVLWDEYDMAVDDYEAQQRKATSILRVMLQIPDIEMRKVVLMARLSPWSNVCFNTQRGNALVFLLMQRSRAVRRIARIWRVFKAHKTAVVCLQRFCRQYALKHRGLKRKRSHMLMCDE
tara:strand:+ start:2436 stop:3956 length:1521 start_codon:yes stop_codon:yes gene_type:complete